MEGVNIARVGHEDLLAVCKIARPSWLLHHPVLCELQNRTLYKLHDCMTAFQFTVDFLDMTSDLVVLYVLLLLLLCSYSLCSLLSIAEAF